MTLEELAKWLEGDGGVMSAMNASQRFAAAAAAIRELADLRGTNCGDGWIDGEFDTELRAATDAALAEIKP